MRKIQNMLTVSYCWQYSKRSVGQHGSATLSTLSLSLPLFVFCCVSQEIMSKTVRFLARKKPAILRKKKHTLFIPACLSLIKEDPTSYAP